MQLKQKGGSHMARIDVDGVEALMDALALEADRVARNGPDAIMAGGQAAKEAMEQTVPVRTGGLKGHLTVKGPFYDGINGHHCEVFPTGTDPHGERYATIGFVQEFGRSNMPAQPWMRPVTETQGAAIAKAISDKLMSD